MANKTIETKNKIIKEYILYSIAILVLSIILIILGIFVGKNYFKLRKKRANELDIRLMSEDEKQTHAFMIHNYADPKQQQSIYSLLDPLAAQSRQSVQPLQNESEPPPAFSDEEGAASSSPGLF